MDVFAVARVVVGTGFLSVAAGYDVRTRRVRDPIWIALGTVGLILLALDVGTSTWAWNDWLFAASAAILFYAVFFGKPILDEDGVHLRPVRLALLGAAAVGWLGGLLLPLPVYYVQTGAAGRFVSLAQLATAPVLLVVYQGFYQVGLLRGGADTKAMMALTLLVPVYPDAAPFPLVSLPVSVATPMENLFPFSLIVLVDAAILFLAVPVGYAAVNAVRGEFEWPQAFFGTKASLERLPPHAWLMERIDRHGEHVAVLFPSRSKDEADEIAKLKAAGADRVWVQPKVPFLVPLLVGFLLAFFVGNLMLGFLMAVLPHP